MVKVSHSDYIKWSQTLHSTTSFSKLLHCDLILYKKTSKNTFYLQLYDVNIWHQRIWWAYWLCTKAFFCQYAVTLRWLHYVSLSLCDSVCCIYSLVFLLSLQLHYFCVLTTKNLFFILSVLSLKWDSHRETECTFPLFGFAADDILQ